MTGLYLDISSITGFVYSWMPGEQHKNTGSKGQIACMVFPTDQDHLDLETGEIFENPRYAKLREDKAISGRLDVYERGMGERTVNQMAYFGDTDSDALIHFQYTMPADSFAVLRDHILKGHPPKRVWIECEDEAIGFGWEPDGSGLKWNNVANRRVVISEIRFDFSYSKNGRDEFYSEPVDRDDFSDAARVARANTSRLIAVERLLKLVALVLVGLCAAFLLKLAIR